MRNGYSCVPVALAEGLDIKMNTAVNEIIYGPDGVEVSTTNPRTNTSGNVFKGKCRLLYLKKNIMFYKTKIYFT